jgi:hypothetical protein
VNIIVDEITVKHLLVPSFETVPVRLPSVMALPPLTLPAFPENALPPLRYAVYWRTARPPATSVGAAYAEQVENTRRIVVKNEERILEWLSR